MGREHWDSKDVMGFLAWPGVHHALHAGMAAHSPLAAVLTGLELLLARSQLWQDSAAARVSIAAQLAPLSALALRWRRLQLHAWRATIHKLKQRHAAGRTMAYTQLFVSLDAVHDGVES